MCHATCYWNSLQKWNTNTCGQTVPLNVKCWVVHGQILRHSECRAWRGTKPTAEKNLVHKFLCPINIYIYIYIYTHTGCPRRNVPDFRRVFLMLKYTDITQNTYVQSWTVTEIMARKKCGLLAGPRTVPVSWQSYLCPSLSVVSYYGNSAVKLVLYFSTVM